MRHIPEEQVAAEALVKIASTYIPDCLFLVVACVLIACQAEAFSGNKGVTFDETFYMNTGTLVYQQGDYSLLMRNGVAPLPVLVTHWIGAVSSNKTAVSTFEVWKLQAGGKRVIRNTRRVHLMVTWGIVFVVYAWLLHRQDRVPAMLAASMLVFSPVMIANASVATTDSDFCLAVLIALWALDTFRRNPTWKSWTGALLAVAIAFSTKYSGVFLIPLAGLVAADVGWRKGEGQRRLWNTLGLATAATACAIAGAFVLCVALHGFDLGSTGQSIGFQVSHNRSGHSAFLCGQLSEMGWWYYFPIAFLLKSTPAELAYALVGLALIPPFLYRQLRSGWSDSTPLLWLAAAAAFGACALMSHVNIGIRHILPLYPILILWATDQLAFLGKQSRKLFALLALALVVVQASAAWYVTPHYLSYFSCFVGGPSEGYRYLVDSNLDWGQDLPLLAAEMERMPENNVLVRYFGTDEPEYYGIECTPWQDLDEEDVSSYQTLAISATYLNGVYSDDSDPFRGFRQLRPCSRVGYTIFLFDLTTTEGEAALRTAISIENKRRNQHSIKNDKESTGR